MTRRFFDPSTRPASPNPPDPLAVMLRDWRRRQDDASDTAGLQARVAGAIRGVAGISTPAASALPRSLWVERAAWFSAGLAAAVTVALLAWPDSASRNSATGAAAGWPASVRFSADRIAEKTALIVGMEETFGPHVAWVAEHDQEVDLAIVPDEQPLGGSTLAVRIVVLSRRPDETIWRAVWQSDVVARDEQVVDVAAGPTGTGRLRLWMHPLADGAIAVDGELSLADAAVRIAASFSGVQRPGVPQRVNGHRGNGIEWQVIQTVVPLEPGNRS